MIRVVSAYSKYVFLNEAALELNFPQNASHKITDSSRFPTEKDFEQDISKCDSKGPWSFLTLSSLSFIFKHVYVN